MFPRGKRALEGVGSRCIDLLRHIEPHPVSLRFERERIVWTSDLSDRTPPEMLRGLLEELPRLQALLYDSARALQRAGAEPVAFLNARLKAASDS